MTANVARTGTWDNLTGKKRRRGTDRRIEEDNIQMDLNEMWGCWLNKTGSGRGQVSSFCEHGKVSGLIVYIAPETSWPGKNKSKGVPRQAEVALGVPGRWRSRIISTFGTTRVVGRQPYAPAAFTPGEIPGTHFQRLSRHQGTWFCWKEPWKKSPGNDPGTVRLVAQRLNHYATPGPTSWPGTDY